MHQFWIYYLHRITCIHRRINLFLSLVKWFGEKTLFCENNFWVQSRSNNRLNMKTWQKRTWFLQSTPQWLLLYLNIQIFLLETGERNNQGSTKQPGIKEVSWIQAAAYNSTTNFRENNQQWSFFRRKLHLLT